MLTRGVDEVYPCSFQDFNSLPTQAAQSVWIATGSAYRRLRHQLVDLFDQVVSLYLDVWNVFSELSAEGLGYDESNNVEVPEMARSLFLTVFVPTPLQMLLSNRLFKKPQIKTGNVTDHFRLG